MSLKPILAKSARKLDVTAWLNLNPNCCCAVRGPKRRSWGDLKSQWVPHDTRDQVIDFVRRWSERADIATQKFIRWLGVVSSKFYDWRARYG
jgi:hypothetical protein